MTDPAYVSIAGEYARKIRNGDLPPGIQLPSYAEIATRHGVSDIVVRKALELLHGQGLVRSVRRRGIFVADRPNLVRISPERQMETAEATFGNESAQQVQIDRETASIQATDELAEAFGVGVGDELTHVITRASEDGRPISISDTYQPPDLSGISTATDLEEAIADQLPTPNHAEWLGTTPGDLVKTVSQRFIAADERVVMISNISYPRNRYDSFVFRMKLSPNA
ncbi:GntR family transcriptional regulator [Kibdelosporangium phytohabitans]|uniref:GntR family transcriptional regulator n=1 Tax=Kibdelosporangium phytohabitans TaxID=860235 RepID=A0A0N9IE30_9PSEU|nr:GntR family transcriptional regulator [Kibdelosporangium phytohabitans]ALG14712.1 GntR family transcriptional regulator [Kibdelosporangium phytohabitans]MBE1471662.1 GntR family transcriptional regulator [Kibdelosporangium phytohabitans]